MNDLHRENIARVTRRQLFGSAASGVGLAALASLPGKRRRATAAERPRASPGCPACRISPRRRSESSSSGKGAGRRTSICSTPSR